MTLSWACRVDVDPVAAQRGGRSWRCEWWQRADRCRQDRAGVAMVRAQESRRSNRLFDDPYADVFLTAEPGVFDREQQAARAAVGGMTARVGSLRPEGGWVVEVAGW